MACGALAAALMLGALAAGVVGYHYFAGYEWIDAMLNAAMVLTGMGQIGALNADGAKVFASLYALFSGVVFMTAMGITISPIFHRVLHQFHLDDEDIRKSAGPHGSKEKLNS
jgi:hypothetical protein